jgi:hypothetical protein
MVFALPEFARRCSFSPEDLALLQVAYMGACAEFKISAEDTARRRRIALAVVHAFRSGNSDTNTLKAVGIAAAKA